MHDIRGTLEILSFLSAILGVPIGLAVLIVTWLMYRRENSKQEEQTVHPSVKSYSQPSGARPSGLLGNATRWLFFQLPVGALPIVIIGLTNSVRAQPISFVSLFSRGELLLVAVGILATLISLLITAETTHIKTRMFVAGSSLLCVMMCATTYATITVANVDKHEASVYSLILYIFAQINALSCLLLTNRFDRKPAH
jgi:hypothetical protein